ncbi:MAG: nicotinate-nucleotide--dimethylbenzimidazole phosphoribosyltransferase [Firmicutes bacterium]|nr:nicotinate-nucleotide--dimethylbenzimidazole phosphoribosyltransferase [Bacillota bacterium]
MNIQLEEILAAINESGDLNQSAIDEARARQEVLAKPTGALGSLEDISIQLAGITGKVKNDMKKQAIVIMSADNGVVDEGVASAPQSVTLSQTINFTRHYTGVSSMAKYFGIDLLVVDMGVKMTIPSALYTDQMTDDSRCLSHQKRLTGKIVNRSIAPGTKNLAKEPAMTRDEALRAIMTGMEAAKNIKECGYDIFGIGEMGIGNTTTSACVLAALTGKTGEEVVGRGGGLNDEGLAKKTRIVDEAISGLTAEDVVGILAKVGGFDICAMVGAFLGAAYYRLPVVIDGYISAVAALAAVRLAPKAFNYMFGSHLSKEKGYLVAVEALGIKPYFNLGMRLGEGSGCPISFKIIETACAAMNGMATFAEGAIEADYLEEGKKGNFF